MEDHLGTLYGPVWSEPITLMRSSGPARTWWPGHSELLGRLGHAVEPSHVC